MFILSGVLLGSLGGWLVGGGGGCGVIIFWGLGGFEKVLNNFLNSEKEIKKFL